MKERDTWKEKAKHLANANPGHVTAEQHQAWVEYKKIRNLYIMITIVGGSVS